RCLSDGAQVTGCSVSTTMVSVNNSGLQVAGYSGYPSISADGRWVAFFSNSALVPGDVNGVEDIYVRDTQLGVTERVSVSTAGAGPNNTSFNPAITADGRFVAFESTATNLAPGATNGNYHVFVRDRLAGTTESMSFSWDGFETTNFDINPAISGDGRFVVWSTLTSNYYPLGDNGAHD